MPTSQDIKTVTLQLNTRQAAEKLAELQRRIETIRKKREEALERGDASAVQAYARELRSLERQAERMQSRAETVRDTLASLDKATPKELRRTIKEISRELDSGSVERGSEQWQALTRSMAAAKRELEDIRAERKAAASAAADEGGGLSALGRRWSGLAVTLSAAGDALRSAMGRMESFVQGYAETAEGMADVEKYTGLAGEEVERLQEAFGKMDTRTPRRQLNALAADAGRLGLQSREEVEAFVSAADKINIALGEDLGEGAVKNIGKLAQMFGEVERQGLERAMLSTASVINELAQSSSASEGYLMEFTSRLAGVGRQAGLTQAQIMAFASVMDQNQVGVERGATALQNVLTALFAKPEKMAQAAGLEVTKFCNLLKTDANAALLQFLEALQAKGGMDSLAPLFKEMQMSGSGVTQTLSTLAANLDTLRQTQQQATQAFQDGTSATQEAAKANSTVQARLEKSRNALRDLSDELGRRLLPLYEGGLSALTLFGRSLQACASWAWQHRAALVSIALPLAAYAAGAKLAYLWTLRWRAAELAHNALLRAKAVLLGTARAASLLYAAGAALVRGNLVRAAAAQRLFNAAVRSNPLGLLLSVITAVAVAVYNLTKRTRELTAEQKRQKQLQDDAAAVQRQANEKTAEQISRVQTLTSVVRDNSASLRDRRAAVEELKKIVPGYNAEISEEGRLTRENTAALKDYIEKLRQKALLEASQDKVTEITRESLDAQGSLRELQAALKRQEGLRGALFNKNAWTRAVFGSQEYRDYFGPGAARGTQKAWEKIQSLIVKTTAKTNQDGSKADRSRGYSWMEWMDTYGTKYQQAQDEIARLRGEISQQQQAIDDNRKRVEAVLSDARKIAKDAGLSLAASSGGQQEDTGGVPEYIPAASSSSSSKEDPLKKRREELERMKDLALVVLKQQLSEQKLTQEQYEQARLALEASTLEKQRDLYEAQTPEWAALEGRRLDALQSIKERAAQAQERQEREQQQRLAAFRSKYFPPTLEQELQTEERIIEAYHAEGLISEREYVAALIQAREAYRKKKEEAAKEGGQVGADGSSAPSPQDGQGGGASSLGAPSDPMVSGVVTLGAAIENLQKKLRDGQASWADWAQVGIAAMGEAQAAMQSLSSYYSACSEAEQAAVTKKYDAEIEKAGQSTKKGKKLEEKKQKELAAIKSKYAKRQAAMQVAQTLADVAVNAVKAYQALASIPVVGPALAAAASAAAVASGMLQVAAIKKQQQAQEAGYAEGGFTPPGRRNKPAGVVHAGEFVASQPVVRNRAALPVLRLLDQAQKSGRAASLTAEDIALAALAPQLRAAKAAPAAYAAVQAGAAVPTAGPSSAAAPVRKVGADGPSAPSAASRVGAVVPTAQPAPAAQPFSPAQNGRAFGTNAPTGEAAAADATAAQLRRLSDLLERGIRSTVVLSGPDGLEEQWRRYRQYKHLR